MSARAAIRRSLSIQILFASAFAASVRAEQPIMGMVPRWDGGYGMQAIWSYWESDSLLVDGEEVDNPLGLFQKESKTSIEGVYTWDRSIRMTFKAPYLDRTRLVEVDGVAERQSVSGWGDVKLALPLKHYFNREGFSGNHSLTPQIKLPTGNEGASIPLGDGEFDFGLGYSYEKETPYLLYNYGLTFWKTGSDRKSDRWNFESLVAWNFAKDKFIGLNFEGNWENGSSAMDFELGPTFFWWINDSALIKIGYRHTTRERISGRGFGREGKFWFGWGFIR